MAKPNASFRYEGCDHRNRTNAHSEDDLNDEFARIAIGEPRNRYAERCVEQRERSAAQKPKQAVI